MRHAKASTQSYHTVYAAGTEHLWTQVNHRLVIDFAARKCMGDIFIMQLRKLYIGTVRAC